MNFGFNENTKEFANSTPYNVGIHTGNIITKAEYTKTDTYEALDIVYENLNKGFTKLDRMFTPVSSTGEYPEYTSAEKELSKFQGKVKHILKRFLTEDQIKFEANSFKDMAEQVSALLQEHAIAPKKEFDLKIIYDKNLQYPEVAKGRFMRVEGEDELVFTPWEKTNRLIVEEVASQETADETIF